ncbi:MAG: site-specific integrase [Bacteroidota bacterium]
MNTSIAISLDKRRKKKDGTYPLIMRLTHKRKTTSISLGYAIPLSDWDSKRKQVKKNSHVSSSIYRINNLIQKKKSDAMGVITKLEENDQLESLSVKELRDRIFGIDKGKTSFLAFTEKLVQEMLQAKKQGNARVYKNVRGAISRYLNGVDVRFEEITYKWLKAYEAYYYSQGYSTNGLSFNLRTIRAIFNRAIKEGIVEEKYYPFKNFKIKYETTAKRAIEKEALQKILSLELPSDHPCFHARNFFLASYMMYGMSFVDMAFLQVKNITGGRVQYTRKKTGKPYDIKISDSLNKILSFYTEGKKPNEFVFPFLKRRSLSDQYKDLDQSRKVYNKSLKQIAELCGIEEKLTSYVARHSFATQDLLSEIPIKAISEMLGHTSLSTTEVYLKSLPSNILDSYSERLGLN